MGMMLANLAVKESVAKVRQLLAGKDVYIADGGDYCYVFPADESWNEVSSLAEKLSSELATIAVCGEVYDSDFVHVGFYKKGKLVYEYQWEEEDEPVISGNIEGLFEQFGFNGDKEQYINMLKVREVFAEDKYEKMIVPFGIDYALRQVGYHYIERDGVENTNKENKFQIIEKA